MIALAERTSNRLVDEFGSPLRVPAPTPPPKPRVSASYDAARDTPEFREAWANADFTAADVENDRATRQKLIARSRYEAGSNGYYSGLLQTHVNYAVGNGPRLRLMTQSQAFNDVVESRWQQWSQAVMLPSKLWTMFHAKIQDGESFAIARTNPNLIGTPVKLDLKLIEAEQVQSLWDRTWVSRYYDDGIEFDEFDNPVAYDVLIDHPHSNYSVGSQWETVRIPAASMRHFFKRKRPGQHRAVPEFSSTLNCGIASRRYREATVGGAEVAASHTVVMKTDLTPEAAPWDVMDEIPLQKRMMTALPIGWDVSQMKSENPNTGYSEFVRQQVNEQGRPKSIPVNVGMADSSQHNFASGKLDHQSWFMEIRCERGDSEEQVLNPTFNQWWREAAIEFGWSRELVPRFKWDWPLLPVADERARAEARERDLKNSSTTLTQVYSEMGMDYMGEVLPAMAEENGLTVEQQQELIVAQRYGNLQVSRQGALSNGEQSATPTPAGEES